MKIAIRKFFLEFKQPFTIAAGTREGTHAVFCRVDLDGAQGYGEACLPPYVTETADSVAGFLDGYDLSGVHKASDVVAAIEALHLDGGDNRSARACLDMALHDWMGKHAGKALHEMWGLDASRCPVNTYTIGISDNAELPRKVEQAGDFNLIKVKLGGSHDRETISALRALTPKTLCVDANQGWKTKEDAIAMIDWLSDKDIAFVEQPLQKENIEDMGWVHERSPIPVIADESFQTESDLSQLDGACAGINVKLMKCGGLHAARSIVQRAKDLNMKVLLGCMSESGCGVSAAAQLAPLADWTDLDGPLLIRNDPFQGIGYRDGKIVLSARGGTGVTPADPNFFS